MSESRLSAGEALVAGIGEQLKKHRLPFGSAMVTGLLAYAFAFLNKLPNHDDVVYLFGKGATTDSGRWGIELLRLVIPDYSMPWLHGIVSLMFLAAAICMMLDLFRFQNVLTKLLLPALIICFPSQIGTFCYMYTSSCYAVAFLLAVLAVKEAQKPGLWRKALAAVLTMLMLSIYQAYIAITAGLMILLLVRQLMEAGGADSAMIPANGGSALPAEQGKKCGKPDRAVSSVLREGLADLLVLLAASVLYLLSIQISMRLTGVTNNTYSGELRMYAPGILEGIGLAYRMFVYNLTSRYNMIVVSRFSRALHFAALLAAAVGLTAYFKERRSLPEGILLVLLLLLLPLCICCMYVAVYWSGIHTLVLYGYILLYVLILVVMESLPDGTSVPLRNALKDVLGVSLLAVVVVNVCFANRTFLKLHLAYENASALMTAVTAQIQMQPGYTRDTPVAFYPSAGAALEFAEGFGTEEELAHDIAGAQFQLLTGFTEQAFLENYIGSKMQLVPWEELGTFAEKEEAREMPVYPDEGSIRLIDGVWFVKFAEITEGSGGHFVYHTDPLA